MASRNSLEGKFQIAAEIYRMISPGMKDEFLPVDAMLQAGFKLDVAQTASFESMFTQACCALETRDGVPVFGTSKEDIAKRYTFLSLRMQPLAPVRPYKNAEVMRLAGCTVEESKPGKLYMYCNRYRKRMQQQGLEATTSTRARPEARTLPPQSIEVVDASETEAICLVSPLSSTSSHAVSKSKESTSSTSREPSSTDSSNDLDDSAPLLVRARTCSKKSDAPSIIDLLSLTGTGSSDGSDDTSPLLVRARSKKATPSIIDLTSTTGRKRATVSQAQQKRTSDEEYRNVRKIGYKLATLLHEAKLNGDINLLKFDTANKVADQTNRLLGVEVVSGHGIKEGVNAGRAGKSPPRLGKPPVLDDEDFEHICVAIRTLSAIEQANCDKPLDRPALISLTEKIVNAYMKDNDKAELQGPVLWRRIQQRNSQRQNMSQSNPREDRRVRWLTYQLQLQHYEGWEQELVELGFARLPINEAEKLEHGHIVFLPGMKARIANFDEMRLSMDASEDTSKQGRKGAVPTSTEIKESGHGMEKNSKACTVVAAITAANEALPLLLIFPTKAKPENVKVQYKLLDRMPQISGQFGFSKRRVFDIQVACNVKGGMTGPMLREYYSKVLKPCYPDAADTPGKRIMIKTDSGPGREDCELLFDARASGAYLKTGLPNGTEAGQECDQTFALFKSICYTNRDKLSQVRRCIDGEQATLSPADIAHVIFGGEIEMVNGDSILLRNAYGEAFNTDRLKRAWEKCGYVKATRAALLSELVRHEIVEDLDGNIDDEQDPYGKMLCLLEADNHEACAMLVAKGYRFANDFRRSVNRVSAVQIAGREATGTVRGTRERQDALEKCSSAGQFFRVTKALGCLNQDDALIWRVRKQMKEAATAMQEEKAVMEEYVVKAREAMEFLESTTRLSYVNWKVPELRIVLAWKQGPFPPADEKISTMLKPKLQLLWRSKYEQVTPPPAVAWTEEQDIELERLLLGDVDHLDTTNLMKDAFDRDEEFVVTKFKSMTINRRRSVLRSILSDYTEESLDEIISTIGFEEEDEANNN